MGRINRVFLEELRDLLKIVLPSIYCKEALLLAFHTAALVFRTFLSIQVANLDGKIVKTIVDRNKTQFLKRLLQWLLLAIPATYTNSMIRFLESKLAIAFRTKLTMHLYELYMDHDTYYRVENLDSRLANADQRLTEDVSRFCSTLAHLHSQVSKPTLDVVLMSAKLVALNIQIQENAKNRVSTSVVPCILAGFTVWLTARALTNTKSSVSARTQDFITARGLLISAADAIE